MNIFFKRLYTLYGVCIIGGLFVLFLPLGWLVGTVSRNSEEAWYLVGKMMLRIIRFLLGIRLSFEGTEHIPDRPVIFTANHQGFFDGVFYNFISNRQLIALTAPFPYFPRLFSFWLRKGGCIDVARDFHERALYPTAHSKDAAYSLLVTALCEGKNVLIFPEGHVERHLKLLPFKWGAIRLAMNTGATIIPTTIHGSGRFFDKKKLLLRRATIKICVFPYFKLPNLEGVDLTVDLVTEKTRELELLISSHLPRNIHKADAPVYEPIKSTNATAFFDIDRTLFPSYTQLILVRYLFRKGLLPLRLLPKVVRWYYLEKKGILNHIETVPHIAELFKGWEVEKISQIAEKVFTREIKSRIYTQAQAIILSHKQHGHNVVLISESFECLLKPWADYLGVDDFYGTKLVAKNGILTGKVDGPIAYRRGKLLCANDFCQKKSAVLEDCFAYGDSFGDSVLLRKVRFPFAVNPKKELETIAKKQEIPIIHFSK